MNRFVRAEVLDQLPEQFFAKLANKVNHYVSQGLDIINLGQGNPDLPTPPHIIRKMQEAAQNPTFHKYPPFRGFPFLREAVATFYEREYGVKIDPEKEVAVLFGGKAGLVQLAPCFLNPGDVALVPDPGYPDYWSGIALARAEMYRMPLREENRFLPDYQAIDPTVLPHTKLMFLNYPNNPTAAIATSDFYEETVRFAERHGIIVVHDFAYGGIAFDGHKAPSFLETLGAKEVGVEIYTLSKTYNMAGWRIGFMIGNPEVIEAIHLYQDHVYCSIFGAIQAAAAEALLGPQECVRELSAMYEKRRNLFLGRLRELGWSVPFSKGSFFTWLPVPPSLTSEEFTDLLLEEAHVAVAPGNGFGQHGEGYVRAGLLTNEERLLEAAERMIQVVNRYIK